ncbi:MAG: hypothetical protein KIH69_023205 [Anaerolineae bacterium]|nr:hypothetical protein [Anaerolineae bacterium]
MVYSRNSTANSTDGKYYYSIPNGLSTPSKVIAFQNRTCVVDEPNLKCWGNVLSGNNLGNSGASQSSDIPVIVASVSSPFYSIGLGQYSQCVTQTQGGGAKCWGTNTNGTFGDGTTTNSATPITVGNLGQFSFLSAGVNHMCGLTGNAQMNANEVSCWGNDSLGQLGNGGALGSGQQSLVPSLIPNLSVYDMQAGYNHTCAITGLGGVKCWGSNANRAISSDNTDAFASPVSVLADWLPPPPSTNVLIKTSAMTAPSVSQPIRFNAYLNRPIELSLYTQSVSNLGAFTYKVSWNPARAQMQSINLGTLPNSTGRSFSYVPQMPFINNTLGYAVDTTYSSNASPAGANGDGDLDLAVLTPNATGETLLTLSEAQLAQVNGTPIPINTYNATMVVRASCMGDFDASGKVEINDVQTEAYNYNPLNQAGAPAYDLFYDVDNDTDIDIGDVQKVASRWNKLCSELSTDRIGSSPASKAARSRMATSPISAKVQASADGNTLIVSAQNLERVGAFEVELAYNAKAANIVSAELGDALTGNQRQWLALPLSKNAATGKAIFGAVSLGDGDPGLSGAGNLAKINLATLGKTSADARVLKITLLDVEGNVLATIMPTQASASADK